MMQQSHCNYTPWVGHDDDGPVLLIPALWMRIDVHDDVCEWWPTEPYYLGGCL